MRQSPPLRLVRHASLAAAALVALGACSGAESDAASDAASEVPASVTAGLSTPESVLWDAARDAWWVSNIGGGPNARDDNGFLVRLAADGSMMDTVPFINGADDDITLHAPKGLALVGDTLWVTDIDAVRGFDATTGMPVASVDLAPLGATFLNDIVVGEDGRLYITDTGIAFDETGNVTMPGPSRIFSLTGRTPAEAVVMPAGSAVNGIAWDPSRSAFLVLSFATDTIYTWQPGSAARMAAVGVGSADGLIVLTDGRAIYTSWADSSLHVIDGGRSALLRGGFPDPADLGYDPRRGIIAVPLFSANRVEFLAVPAAGASPGGTP